jgi:hypothetical protein
VGGLRTRTRGRVSTARDAEISAALAKVGVLSAKQIQTLAFSLDSYEACKRRLRKLHEYGLLKRLPRDSVADPYIYYLPKKRFRISSLLDHNLGVNEVYVRVSRACHDLGFYLLRWDGPDVLQTLLSQRTKLAPDAYFQIQRQVDGQIRNSGFFVEYERTVRDSSVLAHKLTRYADLFHSGQFRNLFGIRGMRVLIVYESTFNYPSAKRVAQGLATARRVGVTLARFAALETLQSCTPAEMLTKPIWHKPDEAELVALYGLQE